ncbi:MAG: DUF1549 domain-containing protein [Planctomycetaceae bacterium]|nr:DUF1549 domain-containing protein [Planctomycetaceae bacterium]
MAFIDQAIRQGWKEQQLTPSSPATDGEWCRRLFLDVIGRIPTADETLAFVADKSPAKRGQLVDRLLGDEYRDEYSRNWTNVWTNLLIGRSGGQGRRDLVNRAGMQQYLREAFDANKPYDVLVFELISANGCNKPGEEGFNGAVNFLLDNLEENAVPATAKTSRLFLGQQVQCTQCHNHPFNNWKQDQFWGMNAFFRQTRALRTFDGRDIVSVRLEDEDFAGEGGDPREAEIYFERRDNTLKVVAQPTFIDGATIAPAGYVDEVNRRDELARLVQKSPELPRALVNRMWAHFFGYGFTKPVDDLGPHNPASHPELLAGLAERFAAASFDLRQLVRWLALSEAYSLSSRGSAENEADDPTSGNPPQFSRFYLRQLRPEELYDSLIVATQTPADDARGRDDWLSQFTIALGTDENDETTTFNGTIPQTLMMMNGELIEKATASGGKSFLAELAQSSMRDPEKIERLYLAALSRQPSREELKLAQQLWLAKKGDTAAALEDIWWAILNSNEFILNH